MFHQFPKNVLITNLIVIGNCPHLLLTKLISKLFFKIEGVKKGQISKDALEKSLLCACCL